MADAMELYQLSEQQKAEGKLHEAINTLNQILATDESHVLSHLSLAVLCGRVGQHEQAVQHARRACELDPQDAFNFTALSVTCQRAWQGTQQSHYIQLAEEAMARAHLLQSQT
jgi:Flp pilus assembly protein TadD